MSKQKPIGFKEKIKVLRISQHRTLEEVGIAVGSQKQSVHGWESGKSQPNLETIVRLAALFGVSTDELLGADTAQSGKMNANVILLYNKLLLSGYNDRQIERLMELALEIAELKPKH